MVDSDWDTKRFPVVVLRDVDSFGNLVPDVVTPTEWPFDQSGWGHQGSFFFFLLFLLKYYSYIKPKPKPLSGSSLCVRLRSRPVPHCCELLWHLR